MRTAATLKSIMKVLNDYALAAMDLEEVHWKDLSDDQKSAVTERIKLFASQVESQVNSLSDDPVVKSAVYQWIFNDSDNLLVQNSSRGNDLFVNIEPDEFEEEIDLFERAKETGEINSDILKYKTYEEFQTSIKNWAEIHEAEGRALPKWFKGLKEVFNTDGYKVFHIGRKDKELGMKIFNADNFGTWCVKDENNFNRYGADYYLAIDSGYGPYALISHGDVDPQVKNKQNREFEVVSEKSPIVTIMKFLLGKRLITQAEMRKSEDIGTKFADLIGMEMTKSFEEIDNASDMHEWILENAYRSDEIEDVDRLFGLDIGGHDTELNWLKGRNASINDSIMEDILKEYPSIYFEDFFGDDITPYMIEEVGSWFDDQYITGKDIDYDFATKVYESTAFGNPVIRTFGLMMTRLMTEGVDDDKIFSEFDNLHKNLDKYDKPKFLEYLYDYYTGDVDKAYELMTGEKIIRDFDDEKFEAMVSKMDKIVPEEIRTWFEKWSVSLRKKYKERGFDGVKAHLSEQYQMQDRKNDSRGKDFVQKLIDISNGKEPIKGRKQDSLFRSMLAEMWYARKGQDGLMRDGDMSSDDFDIFKMRLAQTYDIHGIGPETRDVVESVSGKFNSETFNKLMDVYEKFEVRF